jgi:hypothetical protein
MVDLRLELGNSPYVAGSVTGSVLLRSFSALDGFDASQDDGSIDSKVPPAWGCV